jgi:hypothetical protein
MSTHNEALLEAYASCPPSSRVFYTLELWRAPFAQPARWSRLSPVPFRGSTNCDHVQFPSLFAVVTFIRGAPNCKPCALRRLTECQARTAKV